MGRTTFLTLLILIYVGDWVVLLGIRDYPSTDTQSVSYDPLGCYYEINTFG